jgi:hypothetical protein
MAVLRFSARSSRQLFCGLMVALVSLIAGVPAYANGRVLALARARQARWRAGNVCETESLRAIASG